MATRVSNLANNQVVLHEATKSSFHSYGTLIATNDFEAGTTTLTSYWNCSRTTTQYLAQFLGIYGKGATAEIRKRIADGRYTVA